MHDETKTIDDASLQRLIRRCGHFLFHQTNHSQQDEVLQILMSCESMSQKQLQERLSIKPGSASELISKLEDKGCLLRSRDDADRRKVVLTLTEKGKQVALFHQERPAETLLSALTEEERERLAAILQKLLDDWGLRRTE